MSTSTTPTVQTGVDRTGGPAHDTLGSAARSCAWLGVPVATVTALQCLDVLCLPVEEISGRAAHSDVSVRRIAPAWAEISQTSGGIDEQPWTA